MVKVIGEFVEVQGKHEEKKVGILGGTLLYLFGGVIYNSYDLSPLNWYLMFC